MSETCPKCKSVVCLCEMFPESSPAQPKEEQPDAEFSVMEEQPAPVPNNGEDINALLIEHIKRRAEKGERTYGVRLQPFNGRSALKDLRDELLDAAVYVTQEMEERKSLEAENQQLRDVLNRFMKWQKNCQELLPDGLYEAAAAALQPTQTQGR